MVHLPFGQYVSRHPTIGIGAGESRRLEFLRFDCNHRVNKLEVEVASKLGYREHIKISVRDIHPYGFVPG